MQGLVWLAATAVVAAVVVVVVEEEVEEARVWVLVPLAALAVVQPTVPLQVGGETILLAPRRVAPLWLHHRWLLLRWLQPPAWTASVGSQC